MSSFTDMTERRHLLHAMMRLVGAISLVCGLVACSTHEQGAAEQAREDLANSRTPKGRYIAQVREKVREKWDLQMLKLRNSELGYGRLEVVLFVNPKGRMVKLGVVNDEHSSPAFIRATFQAIHEAKLQPMPAEVVSSLSKEDQGFLLITYNAINLPPKGSGWAKFDSAAANNPNERYANQVVAAVQNKWDEYRAMNPAVLPSGYLQTVFYINKQGKVEDIRVVNGRESYPVLTQLTLRAIKDTEFPPIPDLLSKNPRIRQKITYNVTVN